MVCYQKQRNEGEAMKKLCGMLVVFLVAFVSVSLGQAPLPSNVAFHLKEVARTVEQAERALGGSASEQWKIETAQASATEARAKMAEIEQRYGGKYPPSHPDIVAMQNRIAALEAAAGGRAAAVQEAQAVSAQQAAAAGAASGDWLARLGPFVTGMGRPGYDGAKYLIPSATQEAEEMQKRLGIYAAAAAALAAYRQANLGVQETDELRQIAADLETALRQFVESCVQYADQDLAGADSAIQGLEEFVREQEVHMAAAEPVLFPDRFSLESAQGILDRAARLAKNDDPRLTGLRLRMEALKKADSRLRAARAADTRLRPDAYAGSDAAELKQFAEQVVSHAQPGIRLLKTAMVSPDWTEESVVEWTDTTQTALRQRTTRSLTAQVAGRVNAETRLYTVYLGQDRLSNGAWGPTAGHVMFTDPMLGENVK
jgi:hypothetical protein